MAGGRCYFPSGSRETPARERLHGREKISAEQAWAHISRLEFTTTTGGVSTTKMSHHSNSVV